MWNDFWGLAILAVIPALLMTAAWALHDDTDDTPDEEAPPQIDVDLVIRERDALRSRLAASERRSEEIINNLESVIHRLRASRMTYGENNN